MENILENSVIKSKFSHLKLKLKILNIFDDIKGENILFITCDDNVYGFGSNYYGSGGQGHNRPIQDPEIIEELCKKQIEFFINGLTFVIAVDSHGQLYSWGNNNMGELGRPCKSSETSFEKPQKILSLSHESVDKISCGSRHSVILTKKGKLYGWGDNRDGQVGCGPNTIPRVYTPFMIKLKDITNIYSSSSQTFAITKLGSIFRWGKNVNFTLGSDLMENKVIYAPIFYSYRSSIKSIHKTDDHSFFETKSGIIYFDGKLENKINSTSAFKRNQKISFKGKFISIKDFKIYSKNQCVILGATYNEIYSLKFNQVSKTNYKVFADYIFDEYPSSMETFNIIERYLNRKNSTNKRKFKMKVRPKSLHDISISTLNSQDINVQPNEERNKKSKITINSDSNNNEVIKQAPFVPPKIYFSRTNNDHNKLDMSQLLKENLFYGISSDIKQKIIAMHVFDNIERIVILIITSDNNIYSYSFLEEYQSNEISQSDFKIFKIDKLSRKGIYKFFVGLNFNFAVNHMNQIYGWGQNDRSQLGRGNLTSYENEPQLLPNIQILEMSCGSRHSLILNIDGYIYGWGDNSHGQIGCGNRYGEYIPYPLKIESLKNEKVAKIYTIFDSSFCLTYMGYVLSWGLNEYGALGHDMIRIFQPKKINLNYIDNISFSKTNSYFSTTNQKVFYCGQFKNSSGRLTKQVMPRELIFDFKFKSINSLISYREHISIATIEADEIWRLDYTKTVNTSYKLALFYNLNVHRLHNSTLGLNKGILKDYIPIYQNVDLIQQDNQISYELMNRSQHTVNTLEVKSRIDNQSLFSENISVKSNPNKDSLSLNDSIVTLNDKFNRDFESIGDDLGEGSFGTVYKVKSKEDENYYAIKKICFKDRSKDDINSVIREIKILSAIENEKVVKYIDSWLENSLEVYIQTELCDTTLEKIIGMKHEVFLREKFKPMNKIEYFICCELFYELLEGVQYLHSFTPPIIHRDLKPSNILLNERVDNGNHLKICDFGLAKLRERSTNNTRNIGTAHYMAPEIGLSQNYDEKSDIYSLGIIASEIYEIDYHNSSHHTKYKNEQQLKFKFEILTNIINSMLENKDWKNRPDCNEILRDREGWSLNKLEHIQKSNNYKYEIHKLQYNRNRFFINFFNNKLNRLK